MAGLWTEGFETHQNSSQLARKYAEYNGSVQVQAGRVFGSAASPFGTFVAATPSFGTNNTFVLGVGVRFASHTSLVNSGAQGFYVETGANEQCHIEFESTNGSGIRFLIKRGATTVATSSYFDFGVWHYFEFKLTVRDGTDGAYEVRHNGVTDISGSSENLAANGTDGWDVFAFRFSSNLTSTLRLDDIYVCNGTGTKNNDFLGPSVVEGVLPNAAGASTQWTNNGTGDNYTSVDDSGSAVPDESGAGGTVGSDTNGQKDLYGFQDLQNITGTVHFVQLGVQLGMASVGTRTVKTKYRDPDTTEADGSSHVVDTTEYDEFTEVFDDNPANSLAWDVSDIDDGQFGIEVVS